MLSRGSLRFPERSFGVGTGNKHILIGMCGICRIVNKANGKWYVGSTKNEFRFRWYSHRNKLRAGLHANPHLQAAWTKYGEDNFVFEVIDRVTDIGTLKNTEQSYLDTAFQTPDMIYNIYPKVGSNRTIKLSEEQKAHLRKRAQQQYANKEQRQKHLLAVRKSNAKISKLVLVDPNGCVYDNIRNLALFCKEHLLNIRHVYDMSVGRRKSEKGWTLK